MNNIEIKISLPQLWGDQLFEKNEWGDINYIVGSNGTGKSLFAEQLKTQLKQKQYTTRYLNAERLSGFEKANYSYFTNSSLSRGLDISQFSHYKNYGDSFGLSTSAFVILKERLDIKIQIEAFLSDIFGKSIRFVEEGGFLKPKMQNTLGGSEYNLKEQECHGLKELITLLTFLYDNSNECLIFDEPELHLHPQFQSFFLNEMRRLAGNPKDDSRKKIIFVITHSPYFIDLKTINDLKSVIVFKHSKIPAFIDSIDGQDEYIISKFLPRFNTHHKQFFFSENPVFVEGYTDQQLISLIYEKIGKNIGASGSSIIDVGGKDELGVFFKLCNKLLINPIIIADLDALFKGKLRECICEDERVNSCIQELGIGENITSEIGELETKLKIIADNIISKKTESLEISKLITHLRTYIGENDKIENIEKYRLSMLLGIIRYQSTIESIVDNDKKATIKLISSKLEKLILSCKTCNTYFIDRGEIEHYYTQSDIDYLNIKNKDKTFHKEREFILLNDSETIKKNYNDLIALLDNIIPSVEVNLNEHLKFILIEWIQSLQSAIIRGEIKSIEHLKVNARVNYSLYRQIFEIIDFEQDITSMTFTCKIKISNNLISDEIILSINEKTTAFNFEIVNKLSVTQVTK